MSLVLLVEDDPDLRYLLSKSLPFYGHFDVIGVANGIEGLEQSVALLPACIVIDVKMPGLDGYQLARALRGDAQTAGIPLIILTALTREQAYFTSLASGADRFLEKPIKPQDLTRVIQEVLQVDKAHRLRQLKDLVREQEQTNE